MSTRHRSKNQTYRELKKEQQATIGLLLATVGFTLLLMHFVETIYGIPGMPRFWHQNRYVWASFSVAMSFVGMRLLWLSRDDEDVIINWKPSRSGRRFRQIVLYTRVNCGLCDEAAEILSDYSRWLPLAKKVDIDIDPLLVQRFGSCVPVIECDGKVRFKGRVDETLLRRLIEGTTPIPWP